MKRSKDYARQKTSKGQISKKNPNSKFRGMGRSEIGKKKQGISKKISKFEIELENHLDSPQSEKSLNTDNTVVKLLGYPTVGCNIDSNFPAGPTSGNRGAEISDTSSASWQQTESRNSEISKAEDLKSAEKISEKSQEESDCNPINHQETQFSLERGLTSINDQKKDNIRDVYNKARMTKKEQIMRRENGAPVLRPHSLDIEKYYKYKLDNYPDLFRNRHNPQELSKKVKPEVVPFEDCKAYSSLLERLKAPSAFIPTKKVPKIKYYRGKEKIERLRKGLPVIERVHPSSTLLMPNLHEKEVLSQRERLILGAINDASKVQCDTLDEFQAMADKLKGLFEHESKERTQSSAQIMQELKKDIKELRQDISKLKVQKEQQRVSTAALNEAPSLQTQSNTEAQVTQPEEKDNKAQKKEPSQKAIPKVTDPFSQNLPKEESKNPKEESKEDPPEQEEVKKEIKEDPLSKSKIAEETPSVSKLDNNEKMIFQSMNNKPEIENSKVKPSKEIADQQVVEEEKKNEAQNLFSQSRQNSQTSPSFVAREESKFTSEAKENPFLMNLKADPINKFASSTQDQSKPFSRSNTDGSSHPFTQKSGASPFAQSQNAGNTQIFRAKTAQSLVQPHESFAPFARNNGNGDMQVDSGLRSNRDLGSINNRSTGNFVRPPDSSNPFCVQNVPRDSQRRNRGASARFGNQSQMGNRGSDNRESDWNKSPFQREPSGDNSSSFRMGKFDNGGRTYNSYPTDNGGLFGEHKRNNK
ncbi:unnamed protein product [Moneuplotes crassus]|uniref:Uncharacterized protein n=1 Tax=Euplotes crassus TaxID=5936 RepID=A0AAD2D9V7_EUPCR|nr:unnamed protein product [Moneuplotes crassus]